METLWDNIYAQGEKNIRDQMGEALKLSNEGKITNQEFIARMAAIAEDKPDTTNKEEHV